MNTSIDKKKDKWITESSLCRSTLHELERLGILETISAESVKCLRKVLTDYGELSREQEYLSIASDEAGVLYRENPKAPGRAAKRMNWTDSDTKTRSRFQDSVAVLAFYRAMREKLNHTKAVKKVKKNFDFQSEDCARKYIERQLDRFPDYRPE